MSGVRCFVALELPDETVAALTAAGAAIRDRAVEWRNEKWVAEENLHITLKFLGLVPDERVASLVDALEGAVADRRAFALRLAGARCVPSRGRCSMVWATFHDAADDSCARLARGVDSAVAGFAEPETRPFKPHVTLVRARKPHRLDPEALEAANEALACPDAFVSVLSATLFSSTLTRRGPIYERIARWEFEPAG